jgi:hypothetical protein
MMAKRFADKIGFKEFDYKNKIGGFVKFTKNLYNFKPIWLVSNFDKPFPKKPSLIFVNSMSNFTYWKPEWTERVLDKIHP